MKSRIFLIGFMGCGKSTFGKKLANKLGYEFIDLDALIEATYNKSINEIFEFEGENEFRIKESKVLKTIISKQNIVVATGGGTPCYSSNLDVMISNGLQNLFNTDYKKADVNVP